MERFVSRREKEKNRGNEEVRERERWTRDEKETTIRTEVTENGYREAKNDGVSEAPNRRTRKGVLGVDR